MERTLYCLVASMTVGAIILHLGQPSRSAAERRSTELVAHSGAPGSQWDSIRIGPQSDGKGSDSSVTHFFVDRLGHPTRTNSWLAQKRLGREGTVCIGLQTSAQSNQVTAAQWTATLQLINDLRGEYGISSEHVFMDDNLAVPPAPAPSSQDARPTLSSSPLAR